MDLQEAFDAGFDAVREYVDKSFAAFEKRVVALEQRPVPSDGKDADPTVVASIVAGTLRKDMENLRSSVEAIPTHEPVDVDGIVKATTAGILSDIATIKAGIAEVNSATQKAMDAQEVRMATLVGETVQRAVTAMPLPQDGKNGEPGEKGEAGASGKDGPSGRDGISLAGAMIDRAGQLVITLSDGTTRELGHVVGKDADMVVIKGMIDEATHKAIADAVASLPKPKDGERGPQGEVGAMGLQGEKGMTGDRGEPGATGVDGKDADQSVIEAKITEEVQKAVSAIEKPKDGAPGADGVDGAPGETGPAGKDGADVVDLLIDREGNLVAAFSNGRTKSLGPVVGKDGSDGQDADTAAIDAKIAAIPEPEVDAAMITRMIDEAVAKHTPEPVEEFAPDHVAECISLAVKTMAGYAGKAIEPQSEVKQQPPVTVLHMPPINVSFPDQPAPVVNVAAPNVRVEIPKRGKEITRVTEWDKSGRIKSFEKSEE